MLGFLLGEVRGVGADGRVKVYICVVCVCVCVRGCKRPRSKKRLLCRPAHSCAWCGRVSSPSPRAAHRALNCHAGSRLSPTLPHTHAHPTHTLVDVFTSCAIISSNMHQNTDSHRHMLLFLLVTRRCCAHPNLFPLLHLKTPLQPQWWCAPGAVQPGKCPALTGLHGPAAAPDGQGAHQGAGGACRL